MAREKMTKFRADNKLWIQTGKKAAEAGRSGEALHAVLTLMSTMFAALETVIDNQFELHDTITHAAAGNGAPVNGRKP